MHTFGSYSPRANGDPHPHICLFSYYHTKMWSVNLNDFTHASCVTPGQHPLPISQVAVENVSTVCVEVEFFTRSRGSLKHKWPHVRTRTHTYTQRRAPLPGQDNMEVSCRSLGEGWRVAVLNRAVVRSSTNMPRHKDPCMRACHSERDPVSHLVRVTPSVRSSQKSVGSDCHCDSVIQSVGHFISSRSKIQEARRCPVNVLLRKKKAFVTPQAIIDYLTPLPHRFPNRVKPCFFCLSLRGLL